MYIVPVRSYDSHTRSGLVGAVRVIFRDHVVRDYNGRCVAVQVVGQSPNPRVRIIGQEDEGLIEVPANELIEWQVIGLIY